MSTPYSAPGKQRFLYFLKQLQVILEKAEASENPALFIFRENIRTPLFMLESLCRIYKEVHNKKIFNKLLLYFKKLEDNLGRIDYYESYSLELGEQKNIPSSIIGFLKQRKEEEIKALNRNLKNTEWLGSKNKRIIKMARKLEEADWLNEVEDTQAVKKFYQKEVHKILVKNKNGEIKFKDIEEDVHELRRELRWLSIYPHALRGLIQLSPAEDAPAFLQKYLTTEIINSPYNKMPDGKEWKNHITLNSDYFYALSWMIAHLGALKDKGLKVTAVEEALVHAYKVKKGSSAQLAYSVCGETQMTLPEILESAREITIRFFGENILGNLVN